MIHEKFGGHCRADKESDRERVKSEIGWNEEDASAGWFEKFSENELVPTTNAVSYLSLSTVPHSPFLILSFL